MATAIWKPTTAQRFDEMLNILPPLDWSSKGFLVGEVVSHTEEGAATFTALVEIGEHFFECAEPLTRAQFRAVTPADVLANVARP